MSTQKTFSISKRAQSIRYAWQGIVQFFSREHNTWVHLMATIGCGVLAWLTHVNRVEAVLLLGMITLVWMAELFNTAIEKVMDLVSPERKPEVRFIKDVSAAAVLVTAVAALITGLLIFLPKIV
ncbi:MAG: diacylglycerol kinase family protein [Chitinophagaceae bacterium]|nr:diacylglycerol kinase family protein [Chitinophagaceae bacterium]MBN8668938.1 diacylglycerol kinase family protein [Chitinophagales bacterium]